MSHNYAFDNLLWAILLRLSPVEGVHDVDGTRRIAAQQFKGVLAHGAHDQAVEKCRRGRRGWFDNRSRNGRVHAVHFSYKIRVILIKTNELNTYNSVLKTDRF